MMADIYNVEVHKPNYLEEATSMRAAVIAGVGAGVFADFDVIERFIEIEAVHTPCPTRRRAYTHMMPIFEGCYHALRETYDRLADLKTRGG